VRCTKPFVLVVKVFLEKYRRNQMSFADGDGGSAVNFLRAKFSDIIERGFSFLSR